MKGIIFKEDLFRKVIAGEKTETRRVIKLPSSHTLLNKGFAGVPCSHHYSEGGFGCIDCYGSGWEEPPIMDFIGTWDLINKPPYTWEDNPWVWVYKFELTNL